MKKLMKKDGFTLIELMIVVVIIGILASIAIPQFLRYQLKSKTSEAPRNIGAIRTNQEAFAAKWNAYGYAARRPATGGGNGKVAWGTIAAPGDGFDTIGFAPAGAVFYAYSVANVVPVSATGVVSFGNTLIGAGGVVSTPAPYSVGAVDVFIAASANLDAVGDHGSFYATDEDGSIAPVPGNAGESVF